MIWQDAVIGVAQFFFALALFPAIFSADKPHVLTSVMNAALLYVLAAVYWSLHLHWGFAATTVCALGWSVLTFQKLWRGNSGVSEDLIETSRRRPSESS